MDGQQIRQKILEIIDRLHVNRGNYPEDTAIAEEVKRSVEEIRGHLGILYEEGKIKLNKTMHGHSAGFDPVQKQRFRESVTTMPPSDPETTRLNILRTIVSLQGNSSAFIAASRIAEGTGLPLDEVEGQLDLLNDRGRLQLSRTSSGYSALLLPKHRQLLKEQQMLDTGRITQNVVDPKNVFVVHGRNNAAREAMFSFLRTIGLHPLEWSEIVRETGEASPYIGQVLETGFASAQAVVVLMTPDDEVQLREPYRVPTDPEYESRLTPQPRPNVLIEAGMALGLFPKRTVIVEIGSLRPVSDLFGRHAVRLNNSSQKRQDLADRLETAGCKVSLRGRDWHSAGDFEGCITSVLSQSSATESSSDTGVMKLSESKYWLVTKNGHDDGPFCTRCWDVAKNRVRLVRVSEDYLPKCPECGTLFPE